MQTDIYIYMMRMCRYFLDNVAGWILELERGQYFAYEGNYSYFLAQKQSRIKTESKREHFLSSQLAAELNWMQQNQGNKKGSKARVRQLEQLRKKESSGNDATAIDRD
jgi:sulfate-transporting ATPase